MDWQAGNNAKTILFCEVNAVLQAAAQPMHEMSTNFWLTNEDLAALSTAVQTVVACNAQAVYEDLGLRDLAKAVAAYTKDPKGYLLGGKFSVAQALDIFDDGERWVTDPGIRRDSVEARRKLALALYVVRAAARKPAAGLFCEKNEEFIRAALHPARPEDVRVPIFAPLGAVPAPAPLPGPGDAPNDKPGAGNASGVAWYWHVALAVGGLGLVTWLLVKFLGGNDAPDERPQRRVPGRARPEPHALALNPHVPATGKLRRAGQELRGGRVPRRSHARPGGRVRRSGRRLDG